jgi:hypothetical protein
METKYKIEADAAYKEIAEAEDEWEMKIMNGYKLLVKIEELTKLAANLADIVKSLDNRVTAIEARKVGRPPKKDSDEVQRSGITSSD